MEDAPKSCFEPAHGLEDLLRIAVELRPRLREHALEAPGVTGVRLLPLRCQLEEIGAAVVRVRHAADLALLHKPIGVSDDAANSVTRVDPKTNAIVATNLFVVRRGFGSSWAGDFAGSTVRRIQP